MAEPDSNGTQESPEQQFERMLRSYMDEKMLPLLKRHMDEQIEARLPKPVDVGVLAKEVGAVLSPEVQAIATALSGRIAQVEQAVKAPGVQAQAGPATATAGAPQQPQTVVAQQQQAPGTKIADLLVAFSQVAKELLPVWREFKQGGMADLTIEKLQAIRATNPAQAAVYAQILQPDPLSSYIPSLLTNAYVGGLRAQVSAKQMLREQGGVPSPATPSPSSPSSSGSPQAAPIVSPGLHSVSMQTARRPPQTLAELFGLS